MKNEEKYKKIKMGERGAMLSIAAYLFLASIKLVVGESANSEALTADGWNNVTDIAASAAILVGLMISRKPADSNHPYGHWKSESIASLLASFIMMAVGIQVLSGAVMSVWSGEYVTPDWAAASTGAFCAVFMYGIYRFNRRLGEKIDSQAVKAAAKDNLSDVWVSIGAVIGILGARFYLPWLDSVAAIAVGLLICKTAWGIFRETSHYLTDGFSEEELTSYKEAANLVPEVSGVRDIRARKYGNNTVVDIVLSVPPDISIESAHDISTQVEDVLVYRFDVYDVHVHVEPSRRSRPK